MTPHHELGKQGEAAAVAFLEKKGYRIIERNWRHQRNEIDIIAQYGDTLLVLVEVKTRATDFFGFPETMLTAAQQNRLAQAAAAYIEQQQWQHELRFDIMAITQLPQYPHWHIHHIEDAFYPNSWQ
ncbi:MAG: YraN family protein [Sphingobacteriales bacterium]|nr:YraN family protein [Sphingobacteriales bacterium]